MSWLVELGVGLVVGAIIIGLVLFHRRARAGDVGKGAPIPLETQDVRRLGYLPVGSLAARRLQGPVPIIFEWHAGPVWRTAVDAPPALDLDAPDVAVLMARLDDPEIVLTERSMEVRGGDASQVDHHLAAAELLCVLRARLVKESVEDPE